MLYLIGLGLFDERDISVKGLEIAKKCRYVYIEFYTSSIKTNLEKLSKLIGKQVIELTREEVEIEMPFLKHAKKHNVAILIPGDPLNATTHKEILQEAKKRKIKSRVIHSSSIISAASESGLSSYRLGRVISIPWPQEGFRPTGFYEIIQSNLKNNLHTIILLDTEPPMKVGDAIEILFDIEKQKKGKIFLNSTKIIALCALGSEKSKIIYDSMKNLKNKKINILPQAMILPARLFEYEKEAIEQLYSNKS